LEQTLRRAKNAPLKIHIDCSQWEILAFEASWRVQLFQRIFSAETTPQIVVLTIGVNGFLLPEGLIDWSCCNFASLRELSCNGSFSCANPFLQAIDETAINLQKVEFSWSGPEIHLNHMWSRLKDLYYLGATRVPVDDVLPRCQNLNALLAVKTDWPTASTPTTSFAELTWMALKPTNLSHLSKLHLPKLTTFYLTQNMNEGIYEPAAVIRQASSCTIELPMLISLHLEAPVAWLAVFRTPVLKKLVVSSNLPSQDSDMEFLSTKINESPSRYISVDILQVRTKNSDSAVLKVLPLFPNLSTFRLLSSHDHPPTWFGQEIVRNLTYGSSDESVLLPKLRTFNWGSFRTRLDIGEDDAGVVVRRLFEKRTAQGLPLETVTAYIARQRKDRLGKELTFTQERLSYSFDL
jgi:hypothetical protein